MHFLQRLFADAHRFSLSGQDAIIAAEIIPEFPARRSPIITLLPFLPSPDFPISVSQLSISSV